ncbi:hypothetical protein OL67_002006 [Phaeobacter piscinae]|nr:hypothetical protein OL67_002006 [Phaeobacter piscinae]
MERLIQSTRPDLSPVTTLMNPDTCPADLLGWLAWAFSVDVWEPSWDEATKRRVIKAALAVHRRKGTVTALRRVLESIGFDAEVLEWFAPRPGRPPMAPRSFAVVRSIPAGAYYNAKEASVARSAKEAIARTKPVAAQCSFGIEQQVETTANQTGALLGRRISEKAYSVVLKAAGKYRPHCALAMQLRQVAPSSKPVFSRTEPSGSMLVLIRKKEYVHAA